MIRCSSILNLIYLLLCIIFLMQSSAEIYKDNEELKSYDDFLSENAFYESDEDDRYNEELFSKLYEEEESKPYDEIISDREIYESDGHDRYDQDQPSKLYEEEETDASRGFRQIGRRKRRDFKRLLKEHGLISLYSKFVEAGVDEETLWELDDEFLDDAQLTAIQKLRYRKTKEKLFGPEQIYDNDDYAAYYYVDLPRPKRPWPRYPFGPNRPELSIPGPCVDHALQNVKNRNDMVAGGWIINAPHQANVYAAGCGGYNTFWGYTNGFPVGYVEATFKGSGIGTLNFGNCYFNAITKVYLNGHLISSAGPNQSSVVIRFTYKSGDILRIAEEGGGIIKINSLKLEACKQEGPPHWYSW